jgi:molecular chaperone HscB
MMNHFLTLGIESSFEIDSDLMHQAYLKAQQNSHPDRQIGKTDAERQQAALDSAAANDAYRVLKDDYLRAVHLLELEDIKVQGDDANVKPDNFLLMEVMEWNEQVENASGEAVPLLMQKLQSEKDNLIQGLMQELNPQTVIRLGYLEKTLTNLQRKAKGMAA